MTCSRCGAAIHGAASYMGLYVTHRNADECMSVARRDLAAQRKRAEQAEATIALLMPAFYRPEGVYGQ